MRHIILSIFAALLLPVLTSAARIAVLSDIHVTPGNQCDSALRVAVNTINSMADVDIVVVDGDLTNEGSDEQLVNVKSILDRIQRPLYVIPGNHENTWSQSATATFPALWGDDRFVTTLPADSLLIVGINCGPYMKMGDGHVKQEDLHWLEKTLSGNLRPGMRVLSFNHYPLNVDLDNVNDYVSLLSRYPVLIHVNGHYHQWQKYRSAGDFIDCVTVRALEMKNGHNPRFGFTLLDINGDDVTVCDMSADGKERTVMYDFRANTNPAPEVTVTEIPASHRVGKWNLERVWTDSASIFTRLAVDKDNVFFSTSTGVVKAVDKRSHLLDWQYKEGNRSLYGKPTLAAGQLFVPTVANGIVVVDPDKGIRLDDIRINGKPIVGDGVVYGSSYYQGGMNTMVAIDPASRSVRWRLDSIIGNYCQAMPATDGRDVVFGAWDTYLYCVDASNGQLRWRWNNGKDVNLFSPGNVIPVLLEDRVVTVAPDRFMTAIDRNTGKTIWRDNSVKYRESLGVSQDGTTAYAKTMDGELIAVDVTKDNWENKWIVDMGIGYDHAPCAVVVHPFTETVLAGSRRGIVTAVDPKSQTVLWSLPLGNSEVNGFDIDSTTGDVYVSLIEGVVWRIAYDK